ncbi:DUF1127 domain-containing protein [Roseomonas sp. F4]
MHLRRPDWDPAPFAMSLASPRPSLWRRIRAAFDRRRRQRLAAQELARLSDHMLADIGLMRWDVGAPRAHPSRFVARAGRDGCGHPMG